MKWKTYLIFIWSKKYIFHCIINYLSLVSFLESIQNKNRLLCSAQSFRGKIHLFNQLIWGDDWKLVMKSASQRDTYWNKLLLRYAHTLQSDVSAGAENLYRHTLSRIHIGSKKLLTLRWLLVPSLLLTRDVHST